MKKFAINTVSSLMSAVVLVGGLAMIPAEAKAGDGDLIKGLIFGAIIAEVLDNDRNDRRYDDRYYDNNSHVRIVNPYNERHRPGYTRGYRTGEVCGVTPIRDRNWNSTTVIKTDCFGRVVDIRRERR